MRYEGDRERHVETENGKTCQDHPEITADELRKEVLKGHIAGPYPTQPLPGFKVVPRGLKEEPTKWRPISEGNRPFGDSVNEGIPRAEHIHLTRTRDIDRRIQRCLKQTGEVWLAMADVKAAYRTMPVRRSHLSRLLQDLTSATSSASASILWGSIFRVIAIVS